MRELGDSIWYGCNIVDMHNDVRKAHARLEVKGGGRRDCCAADYKLMASVSFLSSGIPFTCSLLLGDLSLVWQVRLCLHQGHVGTVVVVRVHGRYDLPSHWVKHGEC